MGRRKPKVDPRQGALWGPGDLQEFAPPKPAKVRTKLRESEIAIVKRAVLAGIDGPGARTLAFRWNVSLTAVKKAMADHEAVVRERRFRARIQKKENPNND